MIFDRLGFVKDPTHEWIDVANVDAPIGVDVIQAAGGALTGDDIANERGQIRGSDAPVAVGVAAAGHKRR